MRFSLHVCWFALLALATAPSWAQGQVDPSKPEKLLEDLFNERMASAEGRPRVLIEKDDRREPYQLEHLSEGQRKALTRSFRATAMITAAERLEPDSGEAGFYRLLTQPYDAVVMDNGVKVRLPVCTRLERFHKQELAGHCSAVLIKPDVIVTANHCIRATDVVNAADLSRNTVRVVFGYQMQKGPPEAAITRLPKDAVRDIKKILFRSPEKYDSKYIDFAVLQLDKAVPADIAEPISIGDDNTIVANTTRVGVIGYPQGLPLKYVLVNDSNDVKGKVTVAAPSAFAALIDTFHGNSGSPVVLVDSPDQVVGIFILGQDDFALDRQNQCAEPVVYQATIKGEIAVRMSLIRPHLQ